MSMNNSEDLKATILHLNYALRKLNPKYLHSEQIRQSVITGWLKRDDVRLVQYKAGHKHVVSTERYQTQPLEELKEAIGKYHPLR
jgi:integrase/recombinase XerD